jgi:hypothetical protein
VSADAFTPRVASSAVVSGALTWDWRRRARFAILCGMTGRPCKPGSDLHGLWRLLLPGTAFPACGVADEADAASPLRPETDGDDEAPQIESCGHKGALLATRNA